MVQHILAKHCVLVVSLLVILMFKLTNKLTKVSIKNSPTVRDKNAFVYCWTSEVEVNF